MRIAEQVTFGGSRLNRAAELRGDAGALAAYLTLSSTRVMTLWRGKPLLIETGDAVQWVPPGHAMLADAGDGLMFLGLDDAGQALFAANLVKWDPKGLDAEAMGAFMDPTLQVHPRAPDGSHFAELRGVMTRLSAREAELAAMARGIFGWHESHGFCARCGAASNLADAGWRRDCPSCGAAHFPRTDPVVIMLVTLGNSVLLGRSPGWPEGMYSLLAGFMEPGETMEAAVRREVMEEAGVPVGAVGYLASQPWVFPSSMMFGCWADAQSRDIRIDENELEEALWVTREEMLRVFAGTHPVIRPPRNGAIAHFLIRNWLADRLR